MIMRFRTGEVRYLTLIIYESLWELKDYEHILEKVLGEFWSCGFIFPGRVLMHCSCCLYGRIVYANKQFVSTILVGVCSFTPLWHDSITVVPWCRISCG